MDGVFTSCGPALVFVWGITASAFGSPVLKVLIPPADPEDLLCFRPSGGPSQPALLWFSYSIQHVLFITCCHGLSEAAVTNAAFLFMERPCWRHSSNRHYRPVPPSLLLFCGHNSKAGVSFAKFMSYKTPNGMPYETKLGKQRKVLSTIDGQTCRSIAEQHYP